MQTIKLNLIPGSVLPVVNVSQYDVNRQFALSVYEGAVSYSLSGKSVEIRGTKPDGNGFAYDAQDGVVSVSGNTVTISTTQQMTAVGGQTMAELRIKSGTTILGTINFILDVEHSALSDDTPISETEIPAIERDMQAAVDQAEAAAQTATTKAGEAATSATSAASSATSAAGSATSAAGSATTASSAATAAATKALEASTSATNAGNSATAAAGSATNAAADALKSEGVANGEQNGTPVGPGSPYYQNNAKYWRDQAAQYATGGLIFQGSIAFASIPTTGMANGDMYNITDDFTTDSRFIEGAGESVKAGADIAWVAGSVNKWDILALGGGGGSDDYSPLINKPQINSVELNGNKTPAELGLATDAAMTGASAESAGAKGLVPAPAAGDNTKFLRGDGTWAEAGGGGGSSYSVFTARFDLSNSNPDTWGEYLDEAVYMTPGSGAWDLFFGHYLCILDTGVELGKLKTDDVTKYEDGTSAPITTVGKDVMVCFPRRGVKIWTDGTYGYVSMTDDPNNPEYEYYAHTYKGNYCDRFYLGKYLGNVESDKLYSTSGATPVGANNRPLNLFRSYARARGANYEEHGYFQLVFLQAMYMLKYIGKNPQIAIGRGYVDSTNTSIYGAVGYTNNKGLDWGESTGKYPMCLFGIEDIIGNMQVWVDGVFLNASGHYLVSDGNYADNGSGYTDTGKAMSVATNNIYYKDAAWDTAAGFVPVSPNAGSSSTFFCDGADVKFSNGGNAAYGGYYSLGDYSGLFDYRGDYSTSYIYTSSMAGRLMYMHQT